MILDSLKEETGPLKVITMTWLTHVIQQGDINRVMEPLLQMLLHPDTARCVLYCHCKNSQFTLLETFVPFILNVFCFFFIGFMIA